MAKKGFVYGAIAGGVVGSVAALLLAPKSGRELRKDIADKTSSMSDQTARIAGQVTDKTVELAKQVGSTASTAASKVKESASTVMDNVRALRSDAKDKLEETGEKIAETAGDIKDKGQDLIAGHRQEFQAANN